MSLKIADATPQPVTRMDAFRLYALHKRFNLARSQKALNRLSVFQGLLVEKAVRSGVVERKDGGAASLRYRSEIAPYPVYIEMGVDEFIIFKKKAAVQVSLLFTPPSALPKVSADFPPSSLPFEAEMETEERNRSEYYAHLHLYRQAQKNMAKSGLALAGVYAAVGAIAGGLTAFFSAAYFAQGFAVAGAGFALCALVTGAYMFYNSAKSFARTFSHLATRITETVVQVALEATFRKP